MNKVVFVLLVISKCIHTVHCSSSCTGGSSLEKITRRLFKSPICGGSIISNRFIVTAAHCCDVEADKKIVSVRVGEHDLGSRKDCVAGRCATPPQDIMVESYVVHEEYDPDQITNDICLIRLKWPVSYNDFVVPICLPTSNDLLNNHYEGTSLEVAGWGVMHVDGNPIKAKVLQTVSLPVLPLYECLKFYGPRVLLSHKLCAGGEDGIDSCLGDSGGPLMGLFNDTSDSSYKYYLIGIVSYGFPKCTGSMPGIYVNVPKYIEWILNKISTF